MKLFRVDVDPRCLLPRDCGIGTQCFADGAVGIELLRALKTRKLLILRNSKRNKNCKNAQPRYTLGTREGRPS